MKIMQKDDAIRIAKILQAARGEDCTFNVEGVCNHNPETTVWCHSNEAEDGKGYGRKAHDIFGAFGCSDCHNFYDNGPAPREEKQFYFHRAMKRSWKQLIKRGVLK
jgi:hypothetical protein